MIFDRIFSYELCLSNGYNCCTAGLLKLSVRFIGDEQIMKRISFSPAEHCI